MASLQSDSARSESFFAHHHPQRLLNAAARSAAFVFESLTTRSHDAIPSPALLSSPTNLQRSRSVWARTSGELTNVTDASNAARSNEKRIFPPVVGAPSPIDRAYLRRRAAIPQDSSSTKRSCDRDVFSWNHSPGGFESHWIARLTEARLACVLRREFRSKEL